MAKIKVVLFTGGFDTGGQGYRIKRAFDRYYPDEFEVRSIHTANSYFAYPSDLQFRTAVHKPLLAAADVLHMRNGIEDLQRLRPGVLDGSDDVGLVCHWHGTRFREEHAKLWPKVNEVGAIQMVSTLDLALLEPGLTWLPSPVDPDEMSRIRAANPKSRVSAETIRVVHAPTNREVKSTTVLLAAISLLASRTGASIALDLIEKKPWLETLQRKALGDIYFDQLHLGYGNNALEAWALGLPVIAGVSDPLVHEIMRQTFLGEFPFVQAAPTNLAVKLEELATDAPLRAQWALRGLDHVHRYHHEKKVVDALAGIYRRALEERRVVHHA